VCYERLLALDPADAQAHNGLANVLRNQARHESAIAHYELAIRNDPRPIVAFQNLLFCMMCRAGSPPHFTSAIASSRGASRVRSCRCSARTKTTPIRSGG
jgi:tetratricopeptide (TPR) repeat protein